MEYWNITTKTRLSYIHTSPDPLDKGKRASLSEIVQKWPRYADQDGHYLIAHDFDVMHPTVRSASWIGVSKRLLVLLRKSKDRLVRKQLDALLPEQGITTEALELRAAMILLPFLLPEAIVATSDRGKSKGQRRTYYKPSAVESQSWLVDMQKPGLDLSHLIAVESRSLQSNNCGGFGPHVLVLSDTDTTDATVYAVIQGNLIYEMASIPEAIDVCLKAAFVFGVSYPPPARSAWTFIQQVVFGMTTEEDFNSSKLLERVQFMRND